jgi:hypothetical protein
LQRLSRRRCDSPGGVKIADPAECPPAATQAGAAPADRITLVGDQLFEPGAVMVDIRVQVDDTTRVPGLMRRLSEIFDRSSLHFDRARKEVRIASEWESRTLVGVIQAVQDWLAEHDVDSVTLSIGERSYVYTNGATTPPVVSP